MPKRRLALPIRSDWAVMLGFAMMAGVLLLQRNASVTSTREAEDMPLQSEAEPLRDEAPRTLTCQERSCQQGRSCQQERSCQESSSQELSWKDRLLRLYQAISAHRVVALAAGMTFYSLLAIFPALAALVAIYSLFADPSALTGHLDTLSGFMPGGALEVARDQLTRVAARGRQSLGWTFLIGLAISLWSANAAMKSLFDTLNIIFGERERRGLVRLNLVSLACTLAGIVFIQLALAAVVILPVTLNYVGLSDRADLLLRAGRWPGLFIALTMSLSFIYRYGPSRTEARWRWISWGSVTAALLWLVASAAFSWYAANFGTYNQTYGSLGAVIGFMTWLWISAIAVLVGAEVDAAAEHGFLSDPINQSRPLNAGRDRGLTD